MCLIENGEISVPEEYKFLTNKYREIQPHLLSKREQEILSLIANELTSREIADKLFLSINTIENHRKSIFNKLGVKNLAGMIMEAARAGYLN